MAVIYENFGDFERLGTAKKQSQTKPIPVSPHACTGGRKNKANFGLNYDFFGFFRIMSR